MGSPLGPAFANIFMSHLENKFLEQCPSSFKTQTYHRYVDDTLVSFAEPSHAALFLEYINKTHPNIKFTMAAESKD